MQFVLFTFMYKWSIKFKTYKMIVDTMTHVRKINHSYNVHYHHAKFQIKIQLVHGEIKGQITL